MEQVRALMSPTLTTQLEQLKSVPKTQKISAMAAFFGSFNFSQVWQRRNELITIHATYKQLDKKIADLSQKVQTLKMPADLSQRESVQQFFQKEMTLSKLGILEIDEGIKLLAERSDTANVAQLTKDLAGLKKNIEEAKPKMEEHFVNLAKKQHIYKQSLELRDMVQLYEKNTAPKVLEGLSGENKTELAKAKDIATTMLLNETEFKTLLGKVSAIAAAKPEVAREVRYMAAYARRMDDPESLIAELLKAKSLKVTKEQVVSLIASELPAIAKKALSYPAEGWYLISSPKPLISERLNAEEMQMLKAMEAADFSKTTPDTLVQYAKKALQVIDKGFATVPAEVAAKRAFLQRGIELFDEQLKVKRLDADQRKNTAAQVAIDMVHVIDQAFAAKTEAGREILKGKLLPHEREALAAVKAKMASLQNDSAKLKTMAGNALDLIDKGFNSQVPPFRATPVPAALKAEIAEVRKNLKLIA